MTLFKTKKSKTFNFTPQGYTQEYVLNSLCITIIDGKDVKIVDNGKTISELEFQERYNTNIQQFIRQNF